MAQRRENPSIDSPMRRAFAVLADGEVAANVCTSCRGKGWRYVRAHRANGTARLDGQPVALRRVECFDCPDPSGEAA
ncbi:hypothetical protein ACGFIV_31445 [Sphaerisporangium sp. NPDC049003]|uniref:hypothetical protein n=1 Tax=Sphaerisporangium sp. NPDC049003 TaxID=3364517 RepID=UPI0037104E9C